MKRELTQREKVLMLFLIVVLMIAGYLKFFSEPVSQQLAQAQNRLADAQDAVLVEQTKLTNQRKMEKKLEQLKAAGAAKTAEIPEYNNMDNVMVQLDSIMSTATDYQLTFQELQFDSSLVSRPVAMNFTAPNYAAAKRILTDLYNCWYRCSLSNIAISAETSVAAQPVSVTLTATFYEKYNEAAAADDPANAVPDPADAAASSADGAAASAG
ncbi:MAG: hypothetical protein LKJ80_07335 [Oscillibacter sp.]|nr:hypothetical protein [Oscillibacter sp.]